MLDELVQKFAMVRTLRRHKQVVLAVHQRDPNLQKLVRQLAKREPVFVPPRVLHKVELNEPQLARKLVQKPHVLRLLHQKQKKIVPFRAYPPQVPHPLLRQIRQTPKLLQVNPRPVVP